MPRSQLITTRTGIDACIQLIDEGVKEVLADQPDAELSEDEVWTDLAASLLVDANEKIAREVCRTQIGWVPQSLEDLWVRRAEDRRQQQLANGRARTRAAAEAKAAAEKAAAVAERDRIRAQRCPTCFVTRTPAGNCNC